MQACAGTGGTLYNYPIAIPLGDQPPEAQALDKEFRLVLGLRVQRRGAQRLSVDAVLWSDFVPGQVNAAVLLGYWFAFHGRVEALFAARTFRPGPSRECFAVPSGSGAAGDGAPAEAPLEHSERSGFGTFRVRRYRRVETFTVSSRTERKGKTPRRVKVRKVQRDTSTGSGARRSVVVEEIDEESDGARGGGGHDSGEGDKGERRREKHCYGCSRGGWDD